MKYRSPAEAGHSGSPRFHEEDVMRRMARRQANSRDGQPLFSRMGHREQLMPMFSPTVQLAIRRHIVIQPDRGAAGFDRRQFRPAPLAKPSHRGDASRQPRAPGTRSTAAPARISPACVIDLNRHGTRESATTARFERKAQRLTKAGPRANSRSGHLDLGPARNVTPAHSRQLAGEFDRAMLASAAGHVRSGIVGALQAAGGREENL